MLFRSALVNMPNMTSSNGSWVLRFAEPQGRPATGDLTTPVVMKKVDPTYDAEAKRDYIAGFVSLAALVGEDGAISNVRLVKGLDPRLDLSAISAFTQWRFQPAMRNGKPVELEVLVQIPFALN